MTNAVIHANTAHGGYPFEDGLFGINAEITRKGFFGGLSAEMLNNRKLLMGSTGVTYPDNTTVGYVYDANHNLTAVFDWANRLTSYMYDANNRIISVTKPDGSVTTTVYDDMQRVTSTMEKLPSGAVISGFEYTYDDLSRIIEEKVLAIWNFFERSIV